MMNKNANDSKSLSGLLFFSKLLFAFLFFWVQNFQAQFTVSEGAIVHSEKAVIIYQADSISSIAGSISTSKIFISSGVNITNLDTKNNFEIVKVLPLESKKIEPKNHSVLHIAKAELTKKVEEKIVSKSKNQTFSKHLFSTPKKDVYFSIVGSFSKISVLVSQNNATPIIPSENYQTSLALGWSKLASVYFKNAELLTAQNKSAFSVRPPPFLA